MPSPTKTQSMAVLTISLCVPFTRHNALSRCSHIKQLQSKYRARLSFALRPITLLSNNIYAHFKSSCYSSRATYRSFSARGRRMQSASLHEGFDLYNYAKLSAGKEKSPFLQMAHSLCQSVPNCLHSWNIHYCFLGDLFHWCIWRFRRSGSFFSLSKTLACFPAL